MEFKKQIKSIVQEQKKALDYDLTNHDIVTLIVEICEKLDMSHLLDDYKKQKKFIIDNYYKEGDIIKYKNETYEVLLSHKLTLEVWLKEKEKYYRKVA